MAGLGWAGLGWPAGRLAGWLAGLGWAGLGWAGIAGSGGGGWQHVAAFGIEILPYKKRLLDSGSPGLAGWMAGWLGWAGWLG